MSDSDDEAAARREALAPYRLDEALLERAAPHAFALHCLPAHPGEEITEAGVGEERHRRLRAADHQVLEPGERLRRHLRQERAHGTYWVPLGLMTAAAGLA